MKNRKTEPWRIIIFILSLAFIVFMWSKKDIAAIYATMPPEEIMPLIATTLAVSALKVAAIAVAVFFVKWIIDKAKK